MKLFVVLFLLLLYHPAIVAAYSCKIQLPLPPDATASQLPSTTPSWSSTPTATASLSSSATLTPTPTTTPTISTSASITPTISTTPTTTSSSTLITPAPSAPPDPPAPAPAAARLLSGIPAPESFLYNVVTIASGDATFESTRHYTCLGTLISPTWVLTAAQCFISPLRNYVLHAASGHSLAGPPHSIAKVLPHPSYNSPNASSPSIYDIQLIQLESPLRAPRGLYMRLNSNAQFPTENKTYLRFKGFGLTVPPINNDVPLQGIPRDLTYADILAFPCASVSSQQSNLLSRTIGDDQFNFSTFTNPNLINLTYINSEPSNFQHSNTHTRTTYTSPHHATTTTSTSHNHNSNIHFSKHNARNDTADSDLDPSTNSSSATNFTDYDQLLCTTAVSVNDTNPCAPCYGDIGGPLYAVDKTGIVDVLVGILHLSPTASYDVSACSTTVNGSIPYTPIAPYIEWIIDTVTAASGNSNNDAGIIREYIYEIPNDGLSDIDLSETISSASQVGALQPAARVSIIVLSALFLVGAAIALCVALFIKGMRAKRRMRELGLHAEDSFVGSIKTERYYNYINSQNNGDNGGNNGSGSNVSTRHHGDTNLDQNHSSSNNSSGGHRSRDTENDGHRSHRSQHHHHGKQSSHRHQHSHSHSQSKQQQQSHHHNLHQQERKSHKGAINSTNRNTNNDNINASSVNAMNYNRHTSSNVNTTSNSDNYSYVDNFLNDNSMTTTTNTNNSNTDNQNTIIHSSNTSNNNNNDTSSNLTYSGQRIANHQIIDDPFKGLSEDRRRNVPWWTKLRNFVFEPATPEPNNALQNRNESDNNNSISKRSGGPKPRPNNESVDELAMKSWITMPSFSTIGGPAGSAARSRRRQTDKDTPSWLNAAWERLFKRNEAINNTGNSNTANESSLGAANSEIVVNFERERAAHESESEAHNNHNNHNQNHNHNHINIINNQNVHDNVNPSHHRARKYNNIDSESLNLTENSNSNTINDNHLLTHLEMEEMNIRRNYSDRFEINGAIDAAAAAPNPSSTNVNRTTRSLASQPLSAGGTAGGPTVSYDVSSEDEVLEREREGISDNHDNNGVTGSKATGDEIQSVSVVSFEKSESIRNTNPQTQTTMPSATIINNDTGEIIHIETDTAHTIQPPSSSSSSARHDRMSDFVVLSSSSSPSLSARTPRSHPESTSRDTNGGRTNPNHRHQQQQQHHQHNRHRSKTRTRPRTKPGLKVGAESAERIRVRDVINQFEDDDNVTFGSSSAAHGDVDIEVEVEVDERNLQIQPPSSSNKYSSRNRGSSGSGSGSGKRSSHHQSRRHHSRHANDVNTTGGEDSRYQNHNQHNSQQQQHQRNHSSTTSQRQSSVRRSPMRVHRSPSSAATTKIILEPSAHETEVAATNFDDHSLVRVRIDMENEDGRHRLNKKPQQSSDQSFQHQHSNNTRDNGSGGVHARDEGATSATAPDSDEGETVVSFEKVDSIARRPRA